MKKLLFTALFILIAATSHAQFVVKAVKDKNKISWYVKNTSTDTLKLVSASARFFHQKGGIIFTPGITIPGGGTYQYTGNFNCNGKYNFKYKTIQIPALDSLLEPGDSSLMSTTSNEIDEKDTIMISGITIYYTKNSVSYAAEAFPEGVTPCPSTSVFISEGTSKNGIKMGSAAAQNMNYGVCEPQLVAIIFDASTLNRKGFASLVPHCYYGRLWSTFGNSGVDYMVYYTFDITTTTGQLEFDTLVELMNIGDYIAITNTSIEALSNFNAVKTTLAKIGFSHSDFSSDPGYIGIIGKKGAVPGEAEYNFCQDPHAVCSFSMEHTLTAKDYSNAIQDYASCFENYVQFLDAAPQVNLVKGISKRIISVYPNPASDFWTISGYHAGDQIELTDMNGKAVSAHISGNIIDASALRQGIYMLRVKNNSETETNVCLLVKN